MPHRTATTEPRARGCFSIDLEDFSQLTCRDMTGHVPSCSPEIDQQMDVVLKLLDEHDVRGTFFALGMLAKDRPDIVRRVHDAGHEIASHGSQHRQAFRQTRDEFRQDVADSLSRLADLTGEPVRGYRAPIFSIGPDNLWALDVLAELGLEYDSSIFPLKTRRYGIEGFDPRPRPYDLPEGGRLTEIPLVVWHAGARRFPVAGGGYLRIMPQFLLRRAVDSAGALDHWFTLYLHPYEFDPAPLDVAAMLPEPHRLSSLKRGILNAKWNLRRGSIIDKVRWLLENVQFTTYADLARQVREREQPRPLNAASATVATAS